MAEPAHDGHLSRAHAEVLLRSFEVRHVSRAVGNQVSDDTLSEEFSMAELKTKQTEASVKDFLNQIPDKQRRDDCLAIARMMEEATGAKPKMWGPSIVGFGSYRYKYASGREGDWMM